MRHVSRVREQKKQFKCDIFNTNFAQKGNLNIHVTKVHDGMKQFKCDICNDEFTSKGSMKGRLRA